VWRSDVAEDVFRQRIWWAAIPTGFFFGLAGGLKAGHPVLGAIIGPFVMAGIGFAVYRVLVTGVANMVGRIVMPDSTDDMGEPYSHIETMEARGDIAGAVAAWEAAIAANPDAIAARVNGADVHARKGNNPGRAAELFREVRDHPKARDETRRYAWQRLIDLQLGPLGDESRALVELSKLAHRWPDTPEGRGARKAIADIKRARSRERP
jgi:hypothetical protein